MEKAPLSFCPQAPLGRSKMRNWGLHPLLSIGVPHSQVMPSGRRGQHCPLNTPPHLVAWVLEWPLSLSSILMQKQLEMEQIGKLSHQVFPVPFLMSETVFTKRHGSLQGI